MNLRRGLFRLWIVGAALFVLAVASINYSGIKAEFDAVATKPKVGVSILAGFRQRYPQYNDLSDVQLADALYKKFYSDMPREQFDKKIAAQPGMFDDLIPAKKSEGLAELPPGFVLDPPPRLTPVDYDPFGPNPWASVGMMAGVAFGFPLVVLILGASLVWAFSGFAATTRPN